MGKNKKSITPPSVEESALPAPKLARRSANKNSTIKSGRTIGERRERLETASERTTARNKAKRHQRRRIICTALAFLVIIGLAVFIINLVFHTSEEIVTIVTEPASPATTTYTPTIEVIDEDAGDSGAQLTARMKEYIGQVEADLRELGLTPVKAVIPSGAIREVDFYLDGYTGFIKMIIDRGAGVSTEDTSRVLRHLAEQGITDFEYIDVRIDGKAYWK